MSPRRRVLFLSLIMAVMVIILEAITIWQLYKTAMSEERARLKETARSQARLIEAVARFDQIYSQDYPGGPALATLSQIKDAHARYIGFGKTGEFTLSKLENHQIVFLLRHRHTDLANPEPVPWDSELAEPMRLALSGRSGTIIGLDYRGVKVLAAFEPVDILNLGIVAKIDLAEIRSPFLKAIAISIILAVILIAIGVRVFTKITDPIIDGLNGTVSELEKALTEVKTLQGILPICSFCKKIREDDGYWSQVEVYLKQRSDAVFSHGICPECMSKHYPEHNKAPSDNDS